MQALNRGLDILVATPGRLLDLMQQGHVSLDAVEIFVLDEADRMLDMGFFPDIKRVIAKLPAKRQSLFFSATMEPEVVALARTLVHDAVHVTIAHEAPAVERIVQKVMFVDRNNKDALLVSLLGDSRWDRVLVFTQMKHMANKVVKKLAGAGISAAAIHGNKSQGARTEALASFKDGRVRVLVATDIAARGLDVDGISHVINYDLPVEPEVYIHRIGRTARAGAGGDAVSFCSAGERDFLRAIEKLIRIDVPVDSRHAFHSEAACRATGADARPAPKEQRGGNGNGGQRPGAGNRAAPLRRSPASLLFQAGSQGFPLNEASITIGLRWIEAGCVLSLAVRNRSSENYRKKSTAAAVRTEAELIAGHGGHDPLGKSDDLASSVSGIVPGDGDERQHAIQRLRGRQFFYPVFPAVFQQKDAGQRRAAVAGDAGSTGPGRAEGHHLALDLADNHPLVAQYRSGLGPGQQFRESALAGPGRTGK